MLRRMEARTAYPQHRLSQVLLNRWVRRPLWFLGGVGIASVFALVLQPRWVDLCTSLNPRNGQCAVIDQQTMIGYVLIVGGFFMMVLGPIVNSLYHLFRYGQKWETSRVETAVSNVPLLAGIAYLIMGFVVAAA